MGDLLKEELLDLIRRFNAQLNAKMSNIIALFLNHKNGSIGAIAGLAIAIVFTWRYLKAPVGRPRRSEKPRNSSSATTSDNSQSAGQSTSSSGACLPCSSLNEYGVSSQEFTTPLPLSLAQVVRQQLNGGRKVTCQLLGVILEESTPEDLQKHAVVRPSVVDVLLEIAKSCDLYLIARVLDDESEEKVISALDAVGVFTIGGLNRNKVLFCSTEAGRSSFVRQLEPDWHIETNSEIISQLARFIRYQLHISTFGGGYIASNVFGSDSLEHYFGCLEKR